MVCKQCGRDGTFSGEICSTCQIRSFLDSKKLPQVVEMSVNAKVSPKRNILVVPVTGTASLPQDMVVRMCFDCNAVYLASRGKDDSSLAYPGTCRYCGLSAGFFDKEEFFFRNIELYGLKKEFIKDLRIGGIVDSKFKLNDRGEYHEMR